MTNRIRQLVSLLFTLVCVAAFAGGDEEDISRKLLVTCAYSDYKSFQQESVVIGSAVDKQGNDAAKKTFVRGSSLREAVSYKVESGQAAECIFPSGNRVKVKIGTGIARAYGMCGGDPEVFASIWVNKRKVLSRYQFAGRCTEYANDRTSFGFEVVNSRARQCQKAIATVTAETTQGASSETQVNDTLPEVCVNFPEVARFPIDSTEYPPLAAKPVVVGSIQIVRATHPVCNEFAKALSSMRESGIPEGAFIKRPVWNDSSETLQADINNKRQYPLRFDQESSFDFNNDGLPDRIFRKSFENTYMHGSVLLIQSGNSRQTFNSSKPLDSASSQLLPCQMDKVHHDIDTCPPLTQKSDDANFALPAGIRREPIQFRARYTHLDPFFYRGTTYMGASSESSDSMDYFAVVKPQPDRRFLSMCLFRKVPENF